MLLQNVARKIFVLRKLHQVCVNIGAIDRDRFTVFVRGLKRHGFQQPLHNRMQTPRADVLSAFVNFESNLSETTNTVIAELEIQAFSRHKRRILLREGRIRLGQNANKVIRRQWQQLNANGQSSLQFGNQIRRLGELKCTGRDKKNMVCADHSIFCRYR